jgi:hypothetical protein
MARVLSDSEIIDVKHSLDHVEGIINTLIIAYHFKDTQLLDKAKNELGYIAQILEVTGK